MEIDKLKLLASVPIDIGICKLYPLKIKDDIVAIGEDRYNEYLSILLFDISDLDGVDGIGDLDLTPYDIIMLNSIANEEFRKKVSDAISLFTKEEVNFYYDKDYAFFYIGDIGDGKIITKDIYKNIRSVLRQQNCIPEKKDKVRPANKTAEDFMKQMEDIKSKYKKYTDKRDDRITLYDLVGAVVWKGNRSYEEVFGYSVFQLYEALDRINIVDNYTFVMNGIYSGNIDTSKMEKELKDLSWIKGKQK